MKLLIDDVIILSAINPPCIAEEDLETQTEICEELRSLLNLKGMHHTIDDYTIGMTIYLYQQKLVLDEWAMHEVLYALSRIDDFNIEYSPLGGAGCDFTIRMKSKDSKSLL